MRVLGAILILLGVLGLAYGGIEYTKREKVLEIGSLEATVDERKTISIPPIAGAALVVAGLFFVMRKPRLA